jgi:Rod binding domain-containing protein
MRKSGPPRAAPQNFEANFLGSMFENMFTDIDGEGPFGGGQATGIWRSFLTQEYAKIFAKAGGIGLGEPVYRALIAHQEGKRINYPSAERRHIVAWRPPPFSSGPGGPPMSASPKAIKQAPMLTMAEAEALLSVCPKLFRL